MTLINTDTTTDTRINPTIDAPDVSINPMAHATTSISPRAVGTQTVGKVTTKDSKIIANDGSNNIGLFGFDDAGNMVVKIAEPGFDANSASNDHLIFNSAQDTFKIAQTLYASIAGTLTVPATTTNGANGQDSISITVPHGLPFTPTVLVEALNLFTGGSYIPIANGSIASTNFGINNSFSAIGTISQVAWGIISDNTNVYINLNLQYATGPNQSAFTYNFSSPISLKIFCLQETAN